MRPNCEFMERILQTGMIQRDTETLLTPHFTPVAQKGTNGVDSVQSCLINLKEVQWWFLYGDVGELNHLLTTGENIKENNSESSIFTLSFLQHHHDCHQRYKSICLLTRFKHTFEILENVIK